MHHRFHFSKEAVFVIYLLVVGVRTCHGFLDCFGHSQPRTFDGYIHVYFDFIHGLTLTIIEYCIWTAIGIGIYWGIVVAKRKRKPWNEYSKPLPVGLYFIAVIPVFILYVGCVFEVIALKENYFRLPPHEEQEFLRESEQDLRTTDK